MTSQSDLHAIVDRLVILQVAIVELIEAEILSVPDVVGSILQIGCCLFYRMLVEAIETRLVDEIEDGLFRMTDSQRGVACQYLPIGLHREHGTEVNALIGIACGMTSHRELRGDGFDVMGHLSRQGNLAVDVASEADGYQLIGMRCEILSGDDFPIACVPILNDS